ncbi:uncharacterized protein LOC143885227 isoform X2 [Tasmannia lanceolata]|uniref:uncharacterized protein LOC143885227 isoform X2 n=1 Tax=Tasmannia lanceolata TaxID=3420 RepID=UPI004064B10D
MDANEDLNMDRLSLIDFSSEFDSLITSPSCAIQNLHSSGLSENCDEDDCFGEVGAESSHEWDDIMAISKQHKEATMLSEPLEPIRTKRVTKCNFRKSLAWDSAFFTSEGVLNPYELAIANKTFKEAERYVFSGIQEDTQKSPDSNSTLGTNSWALENCEVELFEDIQASTQKSASQKLDPSSRSRMRPVMNSKRLNNSKQVSERTLKEAFVHPRVGVIRSGDQHLSSKLPKNLPRANPLPTTPAKRNPNPLASYVCVKKRSNNAKALCGNVGSQRSVAVSKKVISGLSENCDEHDCFGMVGAGSSHEGEDIMYIDKQCKQIPMLSEPSEPIRTKRVAKCNFRKSLTWDSAFFTSEGVLNPDELAIVNKTFKKADRYVLSGIQEDIKKSSDSTSTSGSNSWALKNLEVDLFEDIRASIQKSSDDYDDVSDISSSCSKTGPGKADIQSSSQKLDLSSRSRMRPVLNSNRLNNSKQSSEENSKEALVRPRVGFIRRGDQHLSSKLPKILPRASPLPTTPAKSNPNQLASYVGAKIRSNNAKALCGNVGNQRSLAVSKKVISGDSHSVIPSSPYSKLGSTLSDSTGKSGSKALRNKIDSRNANKSSNSTAKTPPRSLRPKNESENSHLLAYLLSTSKFSPSTSLASSLDALSSESSSSTSTANQKPNKSKICLDISSPSPLRTRNISDSLSSERSDLQKHLQIQSTAEQVSETGSCVKSNSGAQCFKPSGLRMPSPKIGFFDAEVCGAFSKWKLFAV